MTFNPERWKHYPSIPEYMHWPTERYINERATPGRFLYAVMANDFRMAVMCADDNNREALLDWARFVYHEVPTMAFGSRYMVDEWTAKHEEEAK